MEVLQRGQAAAGVSPYIVGDLAGVGQRDRSIDGQRLFGVQAMTKPPRGSTPSSILVNTALADCQTIPRIAAVMMRPMIESGDVGFNFLLIIFGAIGHELLHLRRIDALHHSSPSSEI
jgi:hypothetical protein